MGKKSGKRKHTENGETDGSAEPAATKRHRSENDSTQNCTDDLQQKYFNVERVEIKDRQIFRLDPDDRDIDKKVYNINTEDDFDPDDAMEMPPSGVLVEGIPFHHRKALPLNKKHIRRLYAHGIILRSTPFSHDEDKQLFRNWRNFCEQFEIDYDRAPIYFGWGRSIAQDDEDTIHLKTFVQSTQLHARMCLGLLDRSGLQVRRRCYLLFDPRGDEYGKEFTRPWSDGDVEKLKQLYDNHGPSWQKIGTKLRRNRFEVQKYYERVVLGARLPTKGKEKMRQQEWSEEKKRLLYDVVKNYLRVHPVMLVVRNKKREEEQNLDWLRIAFDMSPGFSAEECKNMWGQLKLKIYRAYEKLNDPNAPVSVVENKAFNDKALKRKYRPMNPKIAYKAIQVMLRLARESIIDELFEIDVHKLTKRLHEAEIHFSSVYSTGAKVLRIVNDVLLALKRAGLLQMLPIDTPVTELIELVGYLMKRFRHQKSIGLPMVHCKVFILRFLARKGWELNKKYAFVDKDEVENLASNVDDSETSEDEREQPQKQKDEAAGKDDGEPGEEDLEGENGEEGGNEQVPEEEPELEHEESGESDEEI